jgi:hypothetical protein
MNLLWIILRPVFVSLECLVCIAGIAAYHYFPHYFAWLTERIGQEADLLRYFGLLPLVLVPYDSARLRAILLPAADKRAILQHWERYGQFRYTCIIGFIYGIVFAAAGIISLLLSWKIAAACQSALLATSLTGALTVAGTLFFASIKIEELFRQALAPSTHN